MKSLSLFHFCNLLRLGFACLAVCLGFAIAVEANGGEQQNSKRVVFEKKVLPILQARCLRCHGEKKQRAGLDLRTRATVLRGGESGPSIVPGNATQSVLWEKIIGDSMPPGKQKLSQAEKGTIRAWIDNGAFALNTKSPKTATNPGQQVTDEDRNFWSFQKPVRPPVPRVKNPALAGNPVDAFILAALEKKGLTLSPPAERLTLLRRACFDLWGLPPSAQQIDEFLADDKPGSYERLIDRLLASPHYGERWARHWLDVAGYADSEGILDADYVRAAAWRYRDYVIQAFNNDTPYDRFLTEQIAGDELVDYWKIYQTQKKLPATVVKALIATGYLRCASDTSRPDFVNIKNAPGYYFQTLDDTVKIVTSSTLGLTVACAKCHSHKYDPIPQRDYYRLQSIFMSGYRPSKWIPQVQRKRPEATAFEEEQAKVHNARIAERVGALRNELEKLRKTFADRLFEERVKKLPDAVRDRIRKAFAMNAKKRSREDKALVTEFEDKLLTKTTELPKVLSAKYPEFRRRVQQINATIKTEEAKRQTFAEIRAFYDLPGDAKTYQLIRGDYLHPAREVRPGVLAVLATPEPFDWEQPPETAKTSGRRLAFARWLTQAEHPLTARVYVNRLWLHHFGRGIVATADNFGRTGARPTHPELLDWLATEFVKRGWNIKAMHRLIMTSNTYRQQSRFDPARHETAKKRDPENKLLWRQRMRRLEAEALRDAVLMVAGTLNQKMFGPPVPMQRRASGEIVVTPDVSGCRRSIYLQVRRSQPLTFLDVFDQPVMQTNCTRRVTSTVSSQALTLLNSDFMVRQAKEFAQRVLQKHAEEPAAYAMLLAFGRFASEKERTQLTKFLEAQTERHVRALTSGGSVTSAQREQAYQRAVADLCHILLGANEFAYVD